MSWPGETWQEGLPARALQGVRELEQRLEWAHKERLQKQAQLDTLEAALHKQRQKHEEERGTWALLARERRDLAEACEQQEREHQQLSRELQAKGTQLSQLEGQLGRAAQRIEELEEELRRCQAELDNLRSSTHLTHCWAPRKEGAELGTWEQNPRLENRPRTPSMRLQPSSPKLGEEQLVHRGAAWHSVPPGGPAPTEDSQRIPSHREEPREENSGPGRGPPDVEAWELRGGLQSVQQELAQCTEQRDQAVAKVSALERRVQQLLEELRGQRQRAGAAQRRLEQQEREHRQELAELERHHREVLEQQGTRSDIPAPLHCPPNKQGLGGSERERRPPGCVRRSLITSRLERVPEKRGTAGKVRGSSAQGPRAVGKLVPGGERGREPEPPPELQALRAEVLGLRQRLAASESLRKGLLETCWKLRQGAWDLAGERRALAEMLPAQDATMQRKEAAQELHGAPGPSPAKGEGRELQALAVELEAQVWGAPGPGLPQGDAQEVGELQVLRGELRALALGKAEAEAQAAQAQERLRRLQETLGLQTERLALACEAQSQHVAELLTEGYERERELECLGQALGEAGRVRGLLEAEVGHLRVLLGGETPPTPLPEPPPTVPEPGPIEPTPTVPKPSPAEPPPTVPESSPPEPPATSSAEPPPTVPEPSPAEPPPTVPEPGPAEPPPTVPEPGPIEPPPTVPEPGPAEPPPTVPEPGPAEPPPTVPEPGPAEPPPTVPEPGPIEPPPTVPEPGPAEPPPTVPEPGPIEPPPTVPEPGPAEPPPTVPEPGPAEPPPTVPEPGPAEQPPTVPEPGPAEPPPTVPEPGPAEPPPTVPEPGPAEPPPTVPEPGPAEPPPTVPEPGPAEPPPTVPEPGPAEPPPTVPEPGPAEPPPTVPEPGPAEPPPTVPEPGAAEPLPTVPEPSHAEPPPTVPESGHAEPPATSSAELLPTVPESNPPEPPPTDPEPSPPESLPTVPEPSPHELPPTVPEPLTAIPSKLSPTAPESGPPRLATPTPAELPLPPELPLSALELAVFSRMWDPSTDLPLLAGKQAWHSERAQLQNILWELQKSTGQAGVQEQLEEVLSHLLQENRALQAELALWQSHAREECTMPATGDGQHQGTSATPTAAPLGDRGQGDLAYVLRTAWPGAQDAQTQTEGPVPGQQHRELISAAFDHTQYEPYGLPEVVMKGFADIPSGPFCPYVLRRGLLGSTPLAQLAPKAEPEEDPAESDMGTSV
ncbi:unnamed protein product [Lepidochelys kempii]